MLLECNNELINTVIHNWFQKPNQEIRPSCRFSFCVLRPTGTGVQGGPFEITAAPHPALCCCI